MRKNTSLTVVEKLAAGGLLSLRKEFCSWAGMCPVTAYKEISEGRLTDGQKEKPGTAFGSGPGFRNVLPHS
jgi:hypothetical protein